MTSSSDGGTNGRPVSPEAAEPHPYPEPALWRIGSPVVAAVLAVTVLVGMPVLHEGPALVATVTVAVVLQVVLMAGRGVHLRRAARLADLPLRWHQFAFLWSMFSGGTYLLAREDSTTSAAIHIGSGLVFALVMLGAFRLLDRSISRRR